MNLKSYSIVIAISYLLFGISLLIVPNEFLTVFGSPLSVHGEMVARTFAASLLGGFAMHYLLQKSSVPFEFSKIIFTGNFVFNSISACVMTLATLQGAMNYLGFVPVTLNLFLSVYSVLMFKKTLHSASF